MNRIAPLIDKLLLAQTSVQIQAWANEELREHFIIVNNLNARLLKEGNQWCWIVGELPEQNCIVGFGDTPEKALIDFCKRFRGDNVQ